MKMKRRLVTVEVKEPTRKIHASVWRVVKRESEIWGERIHCDDIVPRKQSGEWHTKNGSGGG
jgi:hypothetical protein